MIQNKIKKNTKPAVLYSFYSFINFLNGFFSICANKSFFDFKSLAKNDNSEAILEIFSHISCIFNHDNVIYHFLIWSINHHKAIILIETCDSRILISLDKENSGSIIFKNSFLSLFIVSFLLSQALNFFSLATIIFTRVISSFLFFDDYKFFLKNLNNS